jgi:hypothetical protein
MLLENKGFEGSLQGLETPFAVFPLRDAGTDVTCRPVSQSAICVYSLQAGQLSTTAGNQLMSIELSLLILATALLVLITAQLRAIAVMIRETLDSVEVPAREARMEYPSAEARPRPSREVPEHSSHLTLVK